MSWETPLDHLKHKLVLWGSVGERIAAESTCVAVREFVRGPAGFNLGVGSVRLVGSILTTKSALRFWWSSEDPTPAAVEHFSAASEEAGAPRRPLGPVQ